MEKLNDELESLIRVRNRLSQTPDAKLPSVLTSLLPRLVVHLNRHNLDLEVLRAQRNAGDNVVAEEVALRTKLQGQISGIWMAATERIRGGTIRTAPWVAPIVIKLQEPTHWADVTIAFILSLLQASWSIAEEDPAALSDHYLPSLSSLVERLHNALTTQTGANAHGITNASTTELNYRNASWLCLDVLALSRGLPVLHDWDRDQFNELEWKRPSINKLQPRQASSWLETGLFQLSLDLLFFIPNGTSGENGISLAGKARLNHRIAQSEVVRRRGMQRNARGLFPNRQMNGGPLVLSWNEAYLRELKVACITEIGVAIQNQRQRDIDINELHIKRALLLCILVASSHSMHGKVATEVLNKSYHLGLGGSNATSALKPSSLLSGKRKKTLTPTAPARPSGPGDLTFCCSLMSLVLGLETSSSILQKYRHTEVAAKIETILGRANSTQESTAGANQAFQRAPMPFVVAERAVSFILNNTLKEAVLPADNADAPTMHLMVDLAIGLKDQRGEVGSCWAIRILDRISARLALCGATVERLRLVELLQKRNMELLPIVLFRISHDGNDTDGAQDARDRLLRNHRRDQQRRQLSKEYFVEARKVAYKVVVQAASQYFENPNNLEDVFAMPKMVIQCAVMEKDADSHSLIFKASDSLLEVFKKCFARYMTASPDASAVAAVSPLLPSLLNAVCADSKVARRIAAAWASKFLPCFDMPVSLHVCSFLSTDVDPLVAAMAKKWLSSHRPSDVSMANEESLVSFLDLSTDEGTRSLQTSLDAEVKRLSDTSGLAMPACRIVLTNCNFDVGKAQEGLECGRSNLLERAGVIARSKVASSTSAHQHGSRHLCLICYDEVESTDTFSLACDHIFCCSCWQQHLASCSMPLSASCPHYDCTERVAIEDVQEVAPDQVPRWNTATTQLFVAGSREHSQCPSPDCPLVAHICKDVVGRTPSVECTRCNHRYCFHCKEEPHEPARCSDMAEWNAIVESSELWVLKNTKKCPSCHANIEKNEGCNHMTCSRCRAEFCWLCLSPLRLHDEPHTCNKFEPQHGARNERERRAVFFTDRYNAHSEALKYASDQTQTNERDARDSIFSISDECLDLRELALKTLVEARVFLKNSYVAAWAMEEDSHKRKAFEGFQANLELFTEKLSRMVFQKVAWDRGNFFRAVEFSTHSIRLYMARILVLADDDI